MALLGNTAAGASEPWSNGNEVKLYIAQSPRSGASPLDVFVTYPGQSLWVGVLLSLCIEVVGVPYNLSRPSRPVNFDIK